MLGGAIGTIAHGLLPGYTAAPGAYALVGMGALFASMVRTPMTSVLMIFEMTQDYAIAVEKLRTSAVAADALEIKLWKSSDPLGNESGKVRKVLMNLLSKSAN